MSLYSDDDFPHLPDAGESWQESVVIVFDDAGSGLSGFVRLGSEPNQRLSQAIIGLSSRDGLRYRQVIVDAPMADGDRSDEGFRVGPITWRIPNREYVQVSVDADDIALDLKMFDFFGSTPWQVVGGDGLGRIAPNHLESSGRLEGQVRIGERHFDIRDGLAHRDHSWGARDVKIMRSFRWVAGCCGPELSFSAVVVHLAAGPIMKSAWLRRGGELLPVVDFDVVAQVNVDGLTTRGGQAVWTLAGGEQVVVDAKLIDGFITSYRSDHGGPNSTIGVEGIATASCGELRGFCDFNISNNIAGGEQPAPSVCEEYATLSNGISQRPSVVTAGPGE